MSDKEERKVIENILNVDSFLKVETILKVVLFSDLIET